MDNNTEEEKLIMQKKEENLFKFSSPASIAIVGPTMSGRCV